MLQSYLDAGCPLAEAPAAPLADSRESRNREHTDRRLRLPGRARGARLRDRGERVYGTVRSRAGRRKSAGHGIEPVIADVLDLDSLRRAAGGRPRLLLRGVRPLGGGRDAHGLRRRTAERPRQPAAVGGALRLRQLQRRLWPDRRRMGRRGLADPSARTNPARSAWRPSSAFGAGRQPRADRVSAVILRYVGLYGSGPGRAPVDARARRSRSPAIRPSS